jgi:hypothetical protein
MSAAPLRNTYLTKVLWEHTGALVSSRADLLRLGALLRLAAVSPHSAVFLPLRQNRPGNTVVHWAMTQGLADLLIVRRDVPLRPSTWPAIRARLRRGPHRGVLSTMLTPAPRFPLRVPDWDWKRHQLSVSEYAETLVLSGSSQALHNAGDELTWCGNEVAVNSDIRRYGGPALLSQFNGPADRPGRRDASWECMILAEDQIFHRNRWLTATRGPDHE